MYGPLSLVWTSLRVSVHVSYTICFDNFINTSSNLVVMGDVQPGVVGDHMVVDGEDGLGV